MAGIIKMLQGLQDHRFFFYTHRKPVLPQIAAELNNVLGEGSEAGGHRFGILICARSTCQVRFNS